LYTIVVNQPLYGSITPAGPVSVAPGESSPVFTFTPLYGASGINTVVDGVDQAYSATYQFTDVQEDHTISFNTDETGIYDISCTSNSIESYTPDGVFREGSAWSTHSKIWPQIYIDGDYGANAAVVQVENVSGLIELLTTALGLSISLNYNVSHSWHAGATTDIPLYKLNSAVNPDTLSWNTKPTYGTQYDTLSCVSNAWTDYIKTLTVEDLQDISAGVLFGFIFTPGDHSISTKSTATPAPYIQVTWVGTRNITATAPKYGSISSSGSTKVALGSDSPIYTCTPLYGTSGVNLIIDGVAVPFQSTYQFTNVQENHTISFTTTQSGTFNVPSQTNTLSAVWTSTVQHNSWNDGMGNIRSGWYISGATWGGSSPNSSIISPDFTDMSLPPDANYTGSVLYLRIDGSNAAFGRAYWHGYNVTSNFNPLTVCYDNQPTHAVTGTSFNISNNPGSGNRTLNFSSIDATSMITGLGNCFGTHMLCDASPANEVVFSETRTNVYFTFSWIEAKTITATSPRYGSISSSGVSKVSVGSDSPVYTCTPLYGTSGVNLIIDGVSQPFQSTYQFTDVQTDHTISFTTTQSGTFNVPLLTNTVTVQNPDTTYYGNSVQYSDKIVLGLPVGGQAVVIPETEMVFTPDLSGVSPSFASTVNFTSQSIYFDNMSVYSSYFGSFYGVYEINSDPYDPTTITWNNKPPRGTRRSDQSSIGRAQKYADVTWLTGMNNTDCKKLLSASGLYGFYFTGVSWSEDPWGNIKYGSVPSHLSTTPPYMTFSWVAITGWTGNISNLNSDDISTISEVPITDVSNILGV